MESDDPTRYRARDALAILKATEEALALSAEYGFEEAERRSHIRMQRLSAPTRIGHQANVINAFDAARGRKPTYP